MTLMPGEMPVIYSKMPEVSSITARAVEGPNWHNYLMQVNVQRERRAQETSVTKTNTTSEESVQTKREDGTPQHPQQLKNPKNRRDGSGKYIDVSL